MPKSTKSQKELFLEKLKEQQRQEAAAAAAASAEPPRTTGSVRSNDTDSKTTGVFVNQGIFHPSLGVIALSYGVDAGYIARREMKFNSTTGELSEAQQALSTKQALSQAYTGLIQDLSLEMLKNDTREMEVTPENIREISDNPVLVNMFTKCQLGVTLVNTNVEREGNVEINQVSLANLFA